MIFILIHEYLYIIYKYYTYIKTNEIAIRLLYCIIPKVGIELLYDIRNHKFEYKYKNISLFNHKSVK